MSDSKPRSGPAEMSFPRRQARTRRFTLGAPRSFQVSEAGDRVAFLRSSGPEDPHNSLWVLDVESALERKVFDMAWLAPGDTAELPAAERSRRERVRELGGGVVSYDADPHLTRAVCAVAGIVVSVDLLDGSHRVLETEPGAFDVRISPDTDAFGYVARGGLRILDADGDRLLVGESGPDVSWGAAEFVAAEEMGRTRGHWWAPTGDRILAERVDVDGVEKWWIASPVDPATDPQPIRFPAAGTPNAEVGLAIVDRSGGRIDVGWDEGGWEYLAGVSWTDDGLILVVQSRDQRALAVLDVDPETGRCAERRRILDEHWVDLVVGAPRLAGDRLVTVEPIDGSLRLCVDGSALTGDDTQIRAVASADESGALVSASVDPTEIHVARVGWDRSVDWLTTEPGTHSVVASGPTMVITSRTLDLDGARTEVWRDGERVAVLSDLSGGAAMDQRLRLRRSGSHAIVTAVLSPSGPVGPGPLPVLMDPYGGPHAQRVQKARGLFDTSQWFADQGFIVIVADGRGTPGRGPGFERAVRGDLATSALEDQIAALDAVASEDDRLDRSRVAIRGWSFGGYLAALAVLRRPDVFHAAVAGAPVTDWRLYDTHYTERYLGDPSTEPQNYDRSSLIPDAGGLDRPMLIIHGLADDNVVAAHSLRLSRALLEGGRPHTMLPLSGVTHMTPQEDVAENLLLIQLAFIRDALGRA